MLKMSRCGVGLLLAGLVGLACSNPSGLRLGGGSTSGGQGIAGTGGSTGRGLATGQSDCERAGGACDPITPAGCFGWSPNTDGYSCGSSTTFCCMPLSYSPCVTAGGTCVEPVPGTCPGGMFDDTSQYGCSNGGGPYTCCMPSANGGASGVGGASGGAGNSGTTGSSGGSVGIGGGGSGGTSGGTGGTASCLPALCSMPTCAGEFQPNPDNPCGCPICVPNRPDAGVAKDSGGTTAGTGGVTISGGTTTPSGSTASGGSIGGTTSSGGSASAGGANSTGGTSAPGGTTGTAPMTLAQACAHNCAIASGLAGCSTTQDVCVSNCMTTFNNTSAVNPALGKQYTNMMVCVATDPSFSSSADFVCAKPNSPLNQWSPGGPTTDPPVPNSTCEDDICNWNCDDATRGDMDPFVDIRCTCSSVH